MRIRLFVIGIFCLGWIFGQADPYVDSLEKVLDKQISDTARARIYIDLAEYIVDEEKWTSYNQKALDLADSKLGDATGELKKFYLKVKANAVGNLGYLNDEHGDKSKAIDHYFESLDLYDQAGDQQGKAAIYGNLGVIYSNQGDFKEALDYYQKGLQLKEKYAPENVAVSYINIGVVYEELKDSVKALEYYRRGLYSAIKHKDDMNTATAMNNIGSWHYNRRQFKEAIPFLKGAVRYSISAGDEPGTGWVLANLGSSYLSMQEMDSAVYYTSKAEEIADKYDYPRLKESVYEKLYLIHSVREDWREALKYRNLSIAFLDSMENMDAQKNAIRQKMEYDHNLETEKMKLVQEEEQKRAQQRMYFILSGLGISIVFGLVIFNRLRVTRKQKKIIEDQKHLVDEKNQEIMDSIAYAKRIQSAILPEDQIIKNYLPNTFVLYKPKDIVAGDFYWMEVGRSGEVPVEGAESLLETRNSQQGTILIAAADCTGHGVPGAMVSVVCNNGLNRSVKEFGLSDPGEVLDKTRELVIEEFQKSGDEEIKDGMDIALVSLSLSDQSEDLHTQTSHSLSYSGAHNPLWIVRKGATELEEIKANKQPIGQFSHPEPYKTHELRLNKGDSIYIFSDGFADQFGGPRGKKFKSANFKKLLLSIQELDMEDQKKVIWQKFEEWRGHLEQIDDVCVIGVRL